MAKTKADILYESLANFTDEEGAIECGAKMRDYARELEIELNEQVTCNGKGAEREAALLGKVERLERENARMIELLREAIPTIDGDMADAWRTGLKQHISDCLKLPNVVMSEPLARSHKPESPAKS